MRVLVYLGSKFGNSEIYKEACIELADWMKEKKYGLVYGGNAKGSMGILADRVIENGLETIGIMPTFLKDIEIIHKKLDEFIETKTMQERKDKMREMADFCIAMPGGPGTMEEITEAYSLYLVGQSKLPCVIFNKNGYYDHLKSHYDQMVTEGFLTQEDRGKILFADSFSEIEEFIDRIL